jgi:transcription-repair coupling factor (superfamily II helicase)
MNIDSLKELYRKDKTISAIAERLRSSMQTVHISGLVGSSDAFVGNAIAENTGGVHLFVWEEKEKAIYFCNDLEAINSHDGSVLKPTMPMF